MRWVIWAVPDPAISSGPVLVSLLSILVPVGAVADASLIAVLLAACRPLRAAAPWLTS